MNRPIILERLTALRAEVAEIKAANGVYWAQSVHSQIDTELHERRRERLKEIKEELDLLTPEQPLTQNKPRSPAEEDSVGASQQSWSSVHRSGLAAETMAPAAPGRMNQGLRLRMFQRVPAKILDWASGGTPQASSILW